MDEYLQRHPSRHRNSSCCGEQSNRALKVGRQQGRVCLRRPRRRSGYPGSVYGSSLRLCAEFPDAPSCCRHAAVAVPCRYIYYHTQGYNTPTRGGRFTWSRAISSSVICAFSTCRCRCRCRCRSLLLLGAAAIPSTRRAPAQPLLLHGASLPLLLLHKPE